MAKFGENTAAALLFGIIAVFLAMGIAFKPNIIEGLAIILPQQSIQFLPCKSLGRVWEKDGTCGRCMEGYSSINTEGNGKCFLKSNITVNMREHIAFVRNGTPVILKCTFSTNQYCSWKRRDGYVANHDEAYKYIEQAANTQSVKDCSMLIPSFQDVHVGEWECTSKGTSDRCGEYGTDTYLSNEDVITVGHNETAYVPLGATVVLKCYFKEKENCTWERGDHNLIINDRYMYLARNVSGQKTRDCSIQIKMTEKIDMTLWECKSTATSTKNSILSTTVHLIQVQTPNIIEGPPEINYVSIGERISLRCHFDMKVKCEWSRNGLKMEDTKGFRYNMADAYSTDCSITIPSIEKDDFGKWTCYCEDCIHTQNNKSSWLIKKQNIIVKAPVNESVALGQAVTLICQDPDKNGNCIWGKSGVDVYEAGHYGPASNCTLRINDFQEIDEGKWECTTKDQHQSPKPMNSVWLFKTKSINPFNVANRQFGERLILRCWFQQEVNCSWKVGMTPINPNKTNGYEYIGTYLQTKDCSITIHKFKTDDVGLWLCTSRENSSLVGASIRINGKKGKPPQPKIFISKQANEGENILCVLENGMPDSDLHWQLDGQDHPEIHRKVTKNTDNGLYDVTISLNITEKRFNKAELLSCITNEKHGEWSDKIKIADLHCLMKNPSEGNTSVYSAGVTHFLIISTIILAFVVLGLGYHIRYHKCKKQEPPIEDPPNEDDNNDRRSTNGESNSVPLLPADAQGQPEMANESNM